jgi:integrase
MKVPKVKVEREEYVIYEPELQSMLEQLNGRDEIKGEYVTHITRTNKQTGAEERKEVLQRFNIDCRRAECLLALLWIFGRRIMEILMLKRKHIRIEGDSLVVQFRTLKRRKSDPKELYEKSITLNHPYVPYITKYIESIKEPNSYLFPGYSKPRRFVSKAKLPKTGELKTYNYMRTEEGFMSPQKAWKIIRYLNPSAYCHLFRHTLATTIARKGYNEAQLMAWFDWSTSQVAHGYVSKGKKMVEDLSTRNW